jgi:transposase
MFQKGRKTRWSSMQKTPLPPRWLRLVKQLRAGDLTAVWVPDPRHEAMRDLTWARDTAVEDLRCKRQQVSGFLLRQGLHYPGERTWTKAHRDWLASQKLEYAEQRIAFEEMLLALRQAQEASSGWSRRSRWRSRPDKGNVISICKVRMSNCR